MIIPIRFHHVMPIYIYVHVMFDVKSVPSVRFVQMLHGLWNGYNFNKHELRTEGDAAPSLFILIDLNTTE